MSIWEAPSEEELAKIAAGAPVEPEPVDPNKMIEAMQLKLAANPDPLCPDGRPIHWVLARCTEGIILQDSGAIGPPFKFVCQGIGELSRESLGQLCNVLLEWTANQAPATASFGICFVDTDPFDELGRAIVPLAIP